MKKQLVNKLKSRKGETLVEILVGILIIALAAAMFASMYHAAGAIDLKAREADSKFYDIVSELEKQEKPSEDKEVESYKENGGQIVVTVTDENGHITKWWNFDVDVWAADDMYSYKVKEGS